MAQSWPLNVPNTFQQSGFSFSKQNGAIRTDMDTGPAKVRRRFTAVTTKYRGQIIMTKNEFYTFETWFDVTLMLGSLTFYFPNPLDVTDPIEIIEVRFDLSSDPWTMTPLGDTDDLLITMNIEKVPS